MNEMQKILSGLYDKSLKTRLDTLKKLVQENRIQVKNGGINLHVHTNESFSVFKSPTEAVWHAYKAGIEYFGINDHYTTRGYDEFRKACRLAGIKPIFSIEAIAMDPEASKKKRRLNDPDNPGRVYLIGKGVTRNLKKSGKGYRILQGMIEAIQKRNSEIVDKLNSYCESKGFSINLSYGDVRKLTPNGNATERHVVQAFCEKVDSLASDKTERVRIYNILLNDYVDELILDDPYTLLTKVRAKLIKSGRPCYVKESKKAFTSMENLIDIFLEYGAVPTYPVLANPVTEEEKDLERLINKVKEKRMYAFEIVEFRTELKRAKEIVEVASQNGFPVFIGTEHNTKKLLPLTGEIGKDPELYNYFRKSAQFIVGHQMLSMLCNYGYVTEKGNPRIDNLHHGFGLFSEVGARYISEDQMQRLKKMNLKK